MTKMLFNGIKIPFPRFTQVGVQSFLLVLQVVNHALKTRYHQRMNVKIDVPEKSLQPIVEAHFFVKRSVFIMLLRDLIQSPDVALAILLELVQDTSVMTILVAKDQAPLKIADWKGDSPHS